MTAGDVEQRLKGRPACWISGHFDPMLAEHTRLLRSSAVPGQALVVEVIDSPAPLLSQRARAELVAALGMVDYVVLSNGSQKRAEDPEVSERFVRHVIERHSR